MNSITNYNIGQYEINQCGTRQKIRRTDETEQSSTLSLNGLRDNFFLEMFSYLNLAMLGRSCRINKRWTQVISQSNLWRSAIYREIAFGNDKWIQYFGNEVIAKEDPNEEFSSLPVNDFIANCKKFKAIFPKKAVKDYLMLVRLPKILNGRLNLESLERLINNYFSNTGIKHKVKLPKITQESIEQTCWVSMTSALPESGDKTHLQQRKMVKKLTHQSLIGYSLPGILEYITCSVTKLFDSKVCSSSCNPPIYIRCKEFFEGHPCAIGDLKKDNILDLRYRCEQIAVVAFRRF